MIRVRVLRDGQEVEEVAMADLAAVRAQPGVLIWVEVVSPTPDELATLGREFDIHEVALEDLEIGERQRPKVEQYPDKDQVLLVFYAALPHTDGKRCWPARWRPTPPWPPTGSTPWPATWPPMRPSSPWSP